MRVRRIAVLIDGQRYSGPPFKRLCDLITGQERTQQRREVAGIEALVTADDFIDPPPPVPKVVLTLEVHTL
jgi:hypothetical protein